jgi:hypothetical protein
MSVAAHILCADYRMDFAFLTRASRSKSEQFCAWKNMLRCNMIKYQHIACLKLVLLLKGHAAWGKLRDLRKIISKSPRLSNIIPIIDNNRHKISQLPKFDALLPLRHFVIDPPKESDLRAHEDGHTVIIVSCTAQKIESQGK